MKFIEITTLQAEEIKEFLRNGKIPESLISKEAKKDFRAHCKLFELGKDNRFYHKDSKGGLTLFFTNDELRLKLEEIKNFHEIAHCGGVNMAFSIKNRIYGVKLDEILSIINCCTICQARRLMTTKPVITPIISRKPRDRYLADLIDFRLYKNVNDGYE